MRRNPDALERGEFDCLVIGGGITGATLALEAVRRGYSVALVERDDFGGATSAASSKLLHGGIRYLQQLQLSRVRESAIERLRFERVAPHLVRYVPFLVPTYGTFRQGRLFLAAGLALYRLVTLGHRRAHAGTRLPAIAYRTRADVLRDVPALSGTSLLRGAYVLPEAHVYSTERMTLAFLATAARAGAQVENYTAVEEFLREGNRILGAIVRDRISGRRLTVRARITANAAGPWISALNASAGVRGLERPVAAFSKGAHIVTRALTRDVAIALPTTRRAQSIVDRGGRHVFVIPWRGRSLIGTTNAPFNGPLESVSATESDIADLLADVNAGLPGARLSRADVLHAFAGLYPLTAPVVRPDVYQGTGDYQLVDHARTDGIDGYLSVLGAKFTTARRLADRAVELISRKLPRRPAPNTQDDPPLEGGEIDDATAYVSDAVRRYAHEVEPAVVAHLVASYGSKMDEVLALGRETSRGLRPLAADRESIEAEVTYAVEREMAVHLEDVVFRRTGLGTVGNPGDACLRRCAQLMADRLGWTEDQKNEEVRQTARRFPAAPVTSSAVQSGGR